MKTSFSLAAILLLTLSCSSLTAHADDSSGRAAGNGNDMSAIATYADELLNQGVTGTRFVQMVDQRYWKLNPSANEHPGNRGVGALMQELHSRGLRGEALAKAVEEEQRKRGVRIDQPPSSEEAAQPADANDD